jgi:hypothetical protein
MINQISDDYLAGFVDGEGCFALKYRFDRKYSPQGDLIKSYQYWSAEFVIVLHIIDAPILVLIQQRLGVGRLSYVKTGDQVRYSVQDTKHLHDVVVPFFEKSSIKEEN